MRMPSRSIRGIEHGTPQPFLAVLLLAQVFKLPHFGAARVADAKRRRALERRPKAAYVLPLQGRMGILNLPLTISVFNPLTLGRHPAAGRLPFGALAPEVGWFGSFRGDGTSGRTRRSGEGGAPVPDRCRRRRRRGLKLGAGREPGAGAATANSQCRRADADERQHAGRHNSRSQCRAAAAVATRQSDAAIAVSPPGRRSAGSSTDH
jgi:hypothetical protein